jgi:uncharacterized membrane protein YdbT with pleckstrin-like domain
MGYVDENLIKGESVKYRARRHWVSYGRALLVALALVAAGVLLVMLNAARTDLPFLMWIGVTLFIAAVAVLVATKVQNDAAEFAVTNKRVILKTGIVKRRTIEMFLAKIETVGVDQSVAGRMLNFGTISLVGAGGTTEPFHGIASPLEFRRQVQEQMSVILDQDRDSGELALSS